MFFEILEIRLKRLPLSKGLFALVDDEDFEHFGKWKWTASQQGAIGHELFYAVRWQRQPDGKRKKIWLHREIAQCPEGMVTDHINGDSLNCQKANLRCVTAEENNLHARFKSWCTRTRKLQPDDICL